MLDFDCITKLFVFTIKKKSLFSTIKLETKLILNFQDNKVFEYHSTG